MIPNITVIEMTAGLFVALPDNVEVEEWMLEQATYKDSADNYFFRPTKAQYDELAGRLWEDLKESDKKKEEVTYTYTEFLNLK